MDWWQQDDMAWQRQAQERRRRAAQVAMSMYTTSGAPPPPYYDDLLAMARARIANPQGALDLELAVVLAQMAAELITEQALRKLLGQQAPPRELLRRHQYLNSNLGSQRVRKLYASLANRRIEDESFWGALETHVNRRDGIVHRGDRIPNAAPAIESCEVVHQLMITA
jgi:hypothetical protein